MPFFGLRNFRAVNPLRVCRGIFYSFSFLFEPMPDESFTRGINQLKLSIFGKIASGVIFGSGPFGM